MPAPTTVYDGFTSCAGGMHNGISGARLGPSQSQLLINATTRGDFITNRPGYRYVMRVFGAGGFFQHGAGYRSISGQTFLMAVISGRLFRINPASETANELTIPGDPNPSILMRGWSAQGQRFWVYNDGQTLPLIFNGASARRAGVGELRTGTVTTYVQGRFWYATADGYHFRASDLVGDPSGSAPYNFEDAILKETSNTFLNEGGDFSVPWDSGGIRAMRATAVLDTSQGQGPLQVVCRNSIFSVNTPVDRAIWKDVQYPLQTESLINAGGESHQATVNVNGDLIFRSPDGIRSFIIARRQFRDWGNSPQSYEVSDILKYDDPSLLEFSSAAVFDNRLLMTVSPAFSQNGVYHRGLVALDLSPISSIQQEGIPVYDGLWTGLNILQIVSTDAGAFMFVLASDGGIDLWKLSKDDQFDNETGEIEWTVIPRTFFVERDIADRPNWRMKRLETADIFYDKIAGDPNFTVSWEPDSYPCWTEWKTWEECALTCPLSLGCTPPSNFKTQYRPRFRLPTPPDVCAEGAKGLPLRNFYELNIKIDVRGTARIRGFRVGAIPQGEPNYNPTCEEDPCVKIECCGLDLFTYSSRETAYPYSYYGYSYASGYSYNDGNDGGDGNNGGGGNDTGGDGDGDGGDGDGDGDGEEPVTPPEYPGTPFGCENVGVYYASAENPETGQTALIGVNRLAPTPPEMLDPGVLEAWSNYVWAQWVAEKAANSIVVSNEQLIWLEVPAFSEWRWEANALFGFNEYSDGFSLHFVIAVQYCL